MRTQVSNQHIKIGFQSFVLLIVYATLFECPRIINGSIVTDIYDILDTRSPILHKDLRAV